MRKSKYSIYFIPFLLAALVLWLYSPWLTAPVLANPGLTLSAPGGISLGVLARGTHTGSSAGSVDSTETGWTLTVADTKANNAGYMTLDGLDASGATALTNPLGVGISSTEAGLGESISEYQADLRGLAGYGGTSVFNIPLSVMQERVAGDLVTGSYIITLTYTATP